MKAIFSFIFILMCAEMSLTCSIEFKPPVSVTDNFSLFIGEVIGITSTIWDTTYDTIRIVKKPDITVSESSGNESEKRENKGKQLISKNFSIVDSIIVPRILYSDGDLIVKPLQIYNLPSDIDTVFVYTSAINSNCMLVHEKYDSSYINKQILLGGDISRKPNNKKCATISIPGWDFSAIIVLNPDRAVYNFNTAIDFKKEFLNKNFNVHFELVKQLLLLKKNKSKRKRINIIKNLMFHAYFVKYPEAFKELVNENLKDLSEKKKNKIINQQLSIYDPKSWE